MHPIPSALPLPDNLTPTNLAGENEANVRWLLDTYPDMQLVQQSPRLGQPGLTGGHALC